MQIDKNTLLMWEKFNEYTFWEEPHEYYWKDKKVKQSVTQFTSTFFETFDKEKISFTYAKKNGLDQQEVINKWDRDGLIASKTGTILHSFLENLQRNKVLGTDWLDCEKLGILNEVKEKAYKLMPMAERFYKDIFGKIVPIAMEFTVGIEDKIAGNIDLLIWNKKFQQLEIWDYKFLKDFTTKNNYGKKALFEFSAYDDCKKIHYGIQLNIYKEIIRREIGLEIGACRAIWFNENNESYQIFTLPDLQKEVSIALDRIINV